MNLRAGNLPWRRLLTAGLAAVAIFLHWAYMGERGVAEVAREPSSTESPQRSPASDGWGAGVGFANADRLEEHYRKHGAEFGRITKQDYLRQAQLLRDARVGGPIQQAVRSDGVTTRYDRDTGAFVAFNPDGVIRTFFKPNDGERYFRRQAERGRP